MLFLHKPEFTTCSDCVLFKTGLANQAQHPIIPGYRKYATGICLVSPPNIATSALWLQILQS